jgi:hypothetical protein
VLTQHQDLVLLVILETGSNATVGHGLGVTPAMMISKSLGTRISCVVYNTWRV